MGICAHLILGGALLAISGASCPNGCTYNEGSKECYKYMSDQATWEDAQRNCRAEGARLAAIHNPTENQWLAEFASAGNAHKSLSDLDVSDPWFPWIGYRAPKDDCTFEWTDKHLTRWSNWHNETTMREHCVEERCVCLTALRAHPAYGTWFTARCDELGPYICEKSAHPISAEL